MTKSIRTFVLTLLALCACCHAMVASAADLGTTAPAKTIWDPRVRPASATDDPAEIDPEAQPRLQSALGSSSGSESLSATYPKTTAKPYTKPAAKPQSASATTPPAPQQAAGSYNRATSTATPRTLPPTAKVRLAAQVTAPSAVEPPSVTTQEALPLQPGTSVSAPSAVSTGMPMAEGMPAEESEPCFGRLSCGCGLRKPCESECCEPSCGEAGCCPWYRSVHWFGGVDYLLLNPRLSNPVAFQQETAVTNPVISIDTFNAVKFDYGYNTDYHAFLGFRTECGDAWRFGFWHVEAADSESGTAQGNIANGVGTGVGFNGPGVSATTAGDTITATSHILLNMFDAEHMRPLQWPGCDSGDCPGVAMEWFFGVRVAEFHRSLDAIAPAETGATGMDTVNANTEFTGAGPRFGIEVNRQFGHSAFSAYVGANGSLLLGDFRERSSTVVPGLLQTAVNNSFDNSYRVVPNVEMTAGIRWQPTCKTSITAGWMFEEFGNMSSSTSSSCTNCSGMTSTSVGNDVSFDGLVVRLDHCF